MISSHIIKEQRSTDSYLGEKIDAALDSDDPNVDELLGGEDTVTIFRAVDQLQKYMNFIKLENLVFQTYLEKNDPSYVPVPITHFKKHRKIQFALDVDRASTLRRSSRFMSKTAYSIYDSDVPERSSMFRTRHEVNTTFLASTNKSGNRLNYFIKTELVEKLCSELEQSSNNIEISGKDEITRLAAVCTELKYRNTDLSNTLESFEKTMGYDEKANVLQKISSEKYIKYCESWMKNGMALLSTLRLRISALQHQCYHQKVALEKKRLLGYNLCSVDVEDLKLRQRSLEKEVKVKNKHLTDLKTVTGNVSLTLAIQKKKLLATEDALRNLNSKISITKKDIQIVNKEMSKVEKEIIECSDNFYKLQENFELYSTPSIEQYLNKKLDLQSLEKEEKQLQREINILRVKLQNRTKCLALAQRTTKNLK